MKKKQFSNVFVKYLFAGIGLGVGFITATVLAITVSATFNSGDTLTAANLNVLKTAIESIPGWAKGTTSTDAVYTDGNVGIGTSSPATKLDVAGTVTASAMVGPWDNSNNGYVRLGNVQICWGTGSVTFSSESFNNTSITFPVSFKSGTVPVVTGNPTDKRAYIFTTGSGLLGGSTITNTGFTGVVSHMDNVTGSLTISFNWKAIGVWQ